MSSRKVALVLALGLLATGWVAADEVVLPVVEDTWIDGLSSSSPNGNDLTLAICPVADYWIYLKFDLSSVAGTVKGAELRLTRFSGSRPEEISAYLIEDDTWTEATLTGPSRPAPTLPPDASAIATGEVATGHDRWTSPALTGVVDQQARGDGIVTLMLRENPAQMFDVRYYRSQEASVLDDEKPRLVVSFAIDEVQGVAIAGHSPSNVSWSSAGGGATYDLAGGSLADLRADGGIVGAQCLANDLAGTTWVDPRRAPPSGECDYYLIRVQAGASAGTWGYATAGTERTAPAACP